MAYDIGFTASDATTQGFKTKSGTFSVGGNGGTAWLPLALVAVAALGLWWWFND